MMKRTTLSFIVVQLSLLLIVSLIQAAPTPIAGPIDIEGTIAEAKWLPEKQVKGNAKMTGSAGMDRTIPAHFMVSLKDYKGLDADTVEKMKTFYQWSIPAFPTSPSMPEIVVLRIAHPDKTFLKAGMRIRVIGYRIAGDEGGDYPSYKELKILSGKPQK